MTWHRAWPTAAVAAVLIAAVLGITALISRPHPLRDANTACGGVGVLADGGRTLQLRADNMGFGACILRQLDAPPAVLVHFDDPAQTGPQADRWGDYIATWTASAAGLAMTVRG